MAKTTVSIGIPAYNEEANIQQLLTSLLGQKQDNFVLTEIIVVSDGSTDKTVELSNTLGDPRIKTVDSKERKGQAERQNEVLSLFTGEVLVLLNADVLPKDVDFIETLIAPLESPGVGLVSCKHLPINSKTFVGNVLSFSTELKDTIVEQINNGDNIYLCHGGARAFSKEFAQKLRWPISVGEDAFSYLLCKELGYGFIYLPHTILLYGVPQNLKDHFKQSVRFRNSEQELQAEFPKRDVRKEYVLPFKLFVPVLIRFFFKKPILTISYIAFQLIGLLNPYRVGNSAVWEPSTSSKTLTH